MATITEQGAAGVTTVTTGQSTKVPALNTNDAILNDHAITLLDVVFTSDASPFVLSEVQSRSGILDFSGTTAGAMIVELDVDIQKTWLVRDRSTAGNTLTLRPTGFSGVVIPKNEWVVVRVHGSGANVVEVLGFNAATVVSSFGTNYSAASGRLAPQVRKLNAEDGSAAGFVSLEGSVEKASVIPANGDTILTVPANYRPAQAMAWLGVADPTTNGTAQPVVLELSTGGVLTLRNLFGWAAATGVAIDLVGVSYFAGN